VKKIQSNLNEENHNSKSNFLSKTIGIISRINRVHPLFWLGFVIVSLILFIKFMPHSQWNLFWSVLKSQSLIMVMLLIFCLISVSLVWSAGQRIDAMVFTFFNHNIRHARQLDGLMLGFSQLGNGIFTMALASVLFIGVHHLLAYELVLGTLTLWLVVELIKVLVHRKRPFIKLENAQVVGLRERGCSFPSGHTTQAFFTSTLIIHYLNLSFIIIILLYSISLLVGITRIYVGAHFPRDVFAGAILGSVWGLMGVIVNNYIFK
jgi:membrane-associated phospholipid phosphatase